MNIYQKQIFELLKETYLKGNETEVLQLKDFLEEIEHALYRVFNTKN